MLFTSSNLPLAMHVQHVHVGNIIFVTLPTDSVEFSAFWYGLELLITQSLTIFQVVGAWTFSVSVLKNNCITPKCY